MADLRLAYERAVAELGVQVSGMLAAGVAQEQVARWAAGQRDRLKQVYRGKTPPAALAVIEARSLAQYGNTTGPSVEQLRADGKSWAEIAASAGRPGKQPEGL
ncbi:hemagglutinin [Polaromonas sp.]|uniref:hemagglutinin n=1 Tax=Polaromonas sp. TaxID=1869339 RepID=UPI0037505015